MDQGQSSIVFTSHDLDLTLKNIPCSQNQFKKVVAELDKLEKELTSGDSVKKKSDYIKIDSQFYYVDPMTPLAQRYRNIPDYLIFSRAYEKAKCKN
jgi:uncharacterized protein YchJ